MHEIFDPISGEKGFFCNQLEKTIIDAILIESNKNLVVHNTSSNARGVGR